MFGTYFEVEQPDRGPCCWAEPYQAAGAQPSPSEAVSEAESVSSPPAPFGSCKFFQPGNGNTHPIKRSGKELKKKSIIESL